MAELRERLGGVLYAARALLTAPVSAMGDHEPRVYRAFSAVSASIQGLRGTGLASGELSRCNQYPSKMMESPFDQVGEDDIRISVESFVERLEALEARP